MFNSLRFADDVIITDNLDSVKEIILELISSCEKADLMVNYSKSKIFSNSPQKEITLGNDNIEIIEEVVYLR